jgi:hypothetical protein
VNEVDAGLLAVADDVDPASSCRLTARIVASILPAASALPSSLHAGDSFSGSASQRGFGRLPATVVANMSAPERAIRAQPLERGGGLGVRNREERSSDRSTNRHCQRTREYLAGGAKLSRCSSRACRRRMLARSKAVRRGSP